MSSSWVKRATSFAVTSLFLSTALLAQDQHVTWTVTAEPAKAAPGSKILLRVNGKIEDDWHLYSMSTRGAMPTRFTVTGAAVDTMRPLQPKPNVAHDPNFEVDTESYEKEVTFLLEVAIKKDAPAGTADLAIDARYQVCNPKSCVPSKWAGTASITIDSAASA